VINENQIIAETSSIYDGASGNYCQTYLRLPAKVDFVMRDDSQWFELGLITNAFVNLLGLRTAATILTFN
jgi:hypothetical protein